MKKRLLVLGGNPFQSPLAAIGMHREYEVLVVDEDPECLGKEFATRFEAISIADRDACTKLALDFKPDGVCTAGTDFTTTVSWICSALGLPENRYVPYRTALR